LFGNTGGILIEVTAHPSCTFVSFVDLAFALHEPQRTQSPIASNVARSSRCCRYCTRGCGSGITNNGGADNQRQHHQRETSSVGSCFHCLALGGGIYNAYNAKTLTISNSTVGGNSANFCLFDAETSLRRVR